MANKQEDILRINVMVGDVPIAEFLPADVNTAGKFIKIRKGWKQVLLPTMPYVQKQLYDRIAVELKKKYDLEVDTHYAYDLFLGRSDVISHYGILDGEHVVFYNLKGIADLIRKR